MSLLRKIQDSAIDSNTDLPSLLRMCKILAARLGSEDFKSWVESELNGYTDIDKMPDYRILHVNSKGNFAGPFGSGISNADIPMLTIPEEYREVLSTSVMAQSVASIQALVQGGEGNPREPWSPDFVAIFGRNIYKEMNCMQAWKVIPTNAVVGILDEIRNRILSFVLEIESEDPAAGEAPLNSNPVEPGKVEQIFNTYISGDVQNVATGSHTFKQNAIQKDLNSELFSELLQSLNNLEKPQITDQLSQSVEEMRSTQGSPEFKEHYQRFISLLADHMQVLGPVVAPYLPALAALMP